MTGLFLTVYVNGPALGIYVQLANGWMLFKANIRLKNLRARYTRILSSALFRVTVLYNS